MKLHIANLSYEIDESALRDAFEPFGIVLEVSIPSDRDTGRPRGFGFVTLETPAAAKAATDALNGRELGGRAIRITEARPKTGPGGDPSPGTPSPEGARKNFGPDRRAGAFAARYRNRR